MQQVNCPIFNVDETVLNDNETVEAATRCTHVNSTQFQEALEEDSNDVDDANKDDNEG